MHHRRNQCVSQLSCTKSQPLPRQFFRETWCITDAINAFPGFLAPSLSRFRDNSSGGLGASPTQLMRFQAFLYQVSADSEPILPGDWCITDEINAFPGFLAPNLSLFRANSSGGLGISPTQSMRFQAFLHQVSAASETILPGDLVHHRRNQCVSRLSCTKSQPIPSQFFWGTWCITDAINAFHGFLAPNLSRFRANSPGGLGASPTQSMRFQAFLHQVSADSEAKSRNLHPESNPILKM